MVHIFKWYPRGIITEYNWTSSSNLNLSCSLLTVYIRYREILPTSDTGKSCLHRIQGNPAYIRYREILPTSDTGKSCLHQIQGNPAYIRYREILPTSDTGQLCITKNTETACPHPIRGKPYYYSVRNFSLHLHLEILKFFFRWYNSKISKLFSYLCFDGT